MILLTLIATISYYYSPQKFLAGRHRRPAGGALADRGPLLPVQLVIMITIIMLIIILLLSLILIVVVIIITIVAVMMINSVSIIRIVTVISLMIMIIMIITVMIIVILRPLLPGPERNARGPRKMTCAMLYFTVLCYVILG